MPNSLVFQATTPHPANLNHPARDEYYVVSNLRGGGEFGTEWHLNGNLTRKQNVFDDFAA
jgi:prolyl oligopeptidase